MNKLFVVVGLALTLLAGNVFAQDSLQIQNKYHHGYKNQGKAMNHMQGKHGVGFVDENGDGYNDNAPDVDGDGIPNGMDPDYTGAKARKSMITLWMMTATASQTDKTRTLFVLRMVPDGCTKWAKVKE